MKVKATKLGYYGHRRRYPGQVFFIEKKEHFSKNWMEKVDEKDLVEKELVEENNEIGESSFDVDDDDVI